MKRQLAIFLTVFLALSAMWLIYGSKVVAQLRLDSRIAIDEQGTQIILTPKNSSVSQEYLLEAQRVVTKRLNQLQPADYHQVLTDQGYLEVHLTDSEDAPHLINIVSRVGEVEFIDGGSEPPIGKFVETTSAASPSTGAYQTLFSGQDIMSVLPPEDGQLFYQIIPTPAAAQRFSEFIMAHPNGYICLVIDDEVINCSKMYFWSGDTLEILPNLSSETGLSLSDLGVFLNSGPLPISLQVVTD